MSMCYVRIHSVIVGTPFGASYDPRFGPTACAVGCILSPLRGWEQDATRR